MMSFDHYMKCNLCPRKCGVNRTDNTGYCQQSDMLRIASITPHFGEEPPISGIHGSGTIFFTGCSANCFFCQNYQISQCNMGEIYDKKSFLESVLCLIQQKVHNLNFVTGDHFWPHIAWLHQKLREKDCQIPFLFNSSGYVDPDMVAEYSRCVDIYLPDFKFSKPLLAEVCMNDNRYPQLALTAIEKMILDKGFLHPFDPTGHNPATKGVLVRHLVLPGYIDNSLQALLLLHERFGRHIPLSIMRQFHPTPSCFNKGRLTNIVSKKEYDQLLALVDRLNFKNVLIQDFDPEGIFSPDFSKSNPFNN
jgi:putative pyruvate formate lyase activating enzyme